jgi:methionyl-tRNA formyltransferase
MLGRLLEHDFFVSQLKYVVTKTPRKKGRGNSVSPTAVEQLCASIEKIQVLHADNRRELDEVVAQLPRPMHGVLVSYGVIVSNFVLDHFAPGIINFHPSLLPKHRGPSPVETTILEGDSKAGVSVMQLAEKMDAGPIFAQATIPLTGHESAPMLYEMIVDQCGDWFAEQLQMIFDGRSKPQNQDDSAATYTRMFTKQDGQLDPSAKPADALEREVRAFRGFPKSRLRWNSQDIIVTKSHILGQNETAPMTVPCVNATTLVIDELIAPSGKHMNAEAYLRGLRP